MGLPTPIRVVVADDHPVVRDGLIALLETLPGMSVVAEAGDGLEAVAAAAEHRPDVIVMDLRMPGLDGVSATRQILAARPGIAVLVLTMFDEDRLIADAVAAGARGYLLKGANQADIERAIRTVAAGGVIFDGSVAAKLLPRMTAAGPSLPELTRREREVLDLIARGLSNSVIADRLSLAPKTIGNHISAIFLKIGVSTRAEAIVRARDNGLGGGP
ncbi:response regulator [Microlunatus sp. GCM10028923]|uniref:response regulator n=1 Tax=Microlunatus sp. GCM10028923 TaxID=3273400 RepID=UPI00361AB9CE